jgi:hypothetical protein
MNPNAPPLARAIFLQAVQPGSSREPAALAAVLANQVEGEEYVPNVSALEDALDAEFPWRNQLVFQSRRPESDELDAWTETVRWLMQSLLKPNTLAEGSPRRVHVLLTALGALDVGGEGLSAVSDRFAGTHVSTAIISMLRRVGQIPDGLDAKTKERLEDLSGQVKAGNFKMLRQAHGVFQPRFHSDIWTALFLLWKLEPAELAYILNTRDSIILSMMVCMVLDAHAPLFALQVENVAFKFISLSWLKRREGTSPPIFDPLEVLEQLLLQVATTPHWKGWLHAMYEYPDSASGESRTLAEVLTKLAEPQWRDFIFALAPSTSQGSAQAVADILTHVVDKLGSLTTQPIWSAAFECWNAWDYGTGEGHFFLSSPRVCAFDFPVSMYYACMSTVARDALEQELTYAIVHVEQQWFTSESDLCSERNRLASRLRLIRHGSTLAAGGTAVLPPPVQPDSEYAEVRYRYHDISAVPTRTMGR